MVNNMWFWPAACGPANECDALEGGAARGWRCVWGGVGRGRHSARGGEGGPRARARALAFPPSRPARRPRARTRAPRAEMLRSALARYAHLGFARAAAPARGHAAAAAAAEVVAPLKLFGTSGRYATALYKAAVKSKALPAVAADMKAFSEAVDGSAVIGKFLADPTQSAAEKKGIVDSWAKQAKLSAPVANMFAVLAENGRLADSMGVAADFEKLVLAAKGAVEVTVTSVAKLSPADITALKGFLKTNKIFNGDSFTLVEKLDPSIVGGVVVQAGDKLVDLSVSKRMAKLQRALAAN